MSQNRKKHKQNSYQMIHCPTSEGVIEVSERPNEWAQRSAQAKEAGQSKRTLLIDKIFLFLKNSQTVLYQIHWFSILYPANMVASLADDDEYQFAYGQTAVPMVVKTVLGV